MNLDRQYTNYYVDMRTLHRLNTNEPNNVAVFKINDLINLHSKKQVYLTVPFVDIPGTWYNISNYSGNNRILWLEDTIPSSVPQEFEIVIPDGNYNISTFLATLETVVEAQSAAFGYSQTYVFAYDSTSGKINITIDDPVGHTFTLIDTTTKFSLSRFLGIADYNKGDIYPSVGGLWTSPDVVDFSQPRSIYVRGNTWRNQSYQTLPNSQGAAGDIMTVVPISGNGLIQQTQFNIAGLENERIEVSNPINTFIQVRLTGEDPEFNLDIRSDWNVTFLFQFQQDLIK